jgi:thiamine-phosphate pyrophosphorylase
VISSKFSVQKKSVGALCVITDVGIQSRFSHLELCELAIRGGATAIQLRDKSASDRDLYAYAVAMQTVSTALGATFIVNDRVDIALVANADGVHLGQSDLPIPAARKILGDSKIIGASASSLAEARRAEAEGADYIGFGHIFPTSTKAKDAPPKGISELREALSAVNIPIMAIGGISAKNLSEVLEAGAPSAAVVSAVCNSENPQAATAQLRQIINAFKNKPIR